MKITFFFLVMDFTSEVLLNKSFPTLKSQQILLHFLPITVSFQLSYLTFNSSGIFHGVWCYDKISLILLLIMSLFFQ